MEHNEGFPWDINNKFIFVSCTSCQKMHVLQNFTLHIRRSEKGIGLGEEQGVFFLFFSTAATTADSDELR
jgi:hypothetical protein